MGREIRKVPAGWEHPVDPAPNPRWGPNRWDWTGQGRHFRPLFDESYADAQLAAERDPDAYLDDPDAYRPAWTAEEADHFQLYETITEGTPMSPVFAKLSELETWLVVVGGYSAATAAAFVADGWAASFVGTPDGRLVDGIAAAEPRR